MSHGTIVDYCANHIIHIMNHGNHADIASLIDRLETASGTQCRHLHSNTKSGKHENPDMKALLHSCKTKCALKNCWINVGWASNLCGDDSTKLLVPLLSQEAAAAAKSPCLCSSFEANSRTTKRLSSCLSTCWRKLASDGTSVTQAPRLLCRAA